MKKISVVMAVYRNEATLKELSQRISNVLKKPYEIIFVDDASPDKSKMVIQDLSFRDPRIRLIEQPRNMGQHRSVVEGLKNVCGDVVVVMDADLQDPPEAIEALLAKLEEGFDGVFAARMGPYESKTRLFQSKVFKLLLKWFCGAPTNAGMFFAMSRKMLDTCLVGSARCPFPVVLMARSKLAISSISVERAKRKEGNSAYSFWKRLKLGCEILFASIRHFYQRS